MAARDIELGLLEHLDELRKRMTVAAIALIVGTLIAVVFTKQALEILIIPLGQSIPQTIAPTEHFVVYFRIALIGGLIVSMPVIVYEAVAFALPGLTELERRYLYTMLPGVTLAFAGGIAFAALIMLPAAINFMQSFLDDVVTMGWTLDNYIAFVTRVLFWMGVVFQTPLLIWLLTKLGLIKPHQLTKGRKWAVLAIAVIAALVTPTPDPVNMTIVMVPLYLLFEGGIILSKLAVRRMPKDDEEEESEIEETPEIEGEAT